jgi:hypothetical protein
VASHGLVRRLEHQPVWAGKGHRALVCTISLERVRMTGNEVRNCRCCTQIRQSRPQLPGRLRPKLTDGDLLLLTQALELRGQEQDLDWRGVTKQCT